MIEDLKTEFRLQQVAPELAEKWKNVREEVWDQTGRQLIVTSGFRSFSDQLADWSQGRMKNKNGSWSVSDLRKVVTHAMPGESYHNYGLALDSAWGFGDPYLAKVPPNEAVSLWDLYGELCKQEDLTWGGDWPGEKEDRPHCELNWGMGIHWTQMTYEREGLHGLWQKGLALGKCGSNIS